MEKMFHTQPFCAGLIVLRNGRASADAAGAAHLLGDIASVLVGLQSVEARMTG